MIYDASKGTGRMPGSLASFGSNQGMAGMILQRNAKNTHEVRRKPEDCERSYIVKSSHVHDYVCSEKHISPLYKRGKVSGFRENLLAKRSLVTYTKA